MHTHYDNLRVTRNATPGVIKAAYRALSQEFHPDRNSSHDATRIMIIINEAYAVLSDPAARARYDRKLDLDERQSKSAQQEAAHAKRETDAPEAGRKRAAEAAEQERRAAEAQAAEQKLRTAELREQVRRANEAARKRREARQATRKREPEQPPNQEKDSNVAGVAGGVILLLVAVGGFLVSVGTNTTPAARLAAPAVQATPASAPVLSVATRAPAVEHVNSAIATSLTRQK
ncbi:J domain-containing protein [Paraburkholderia panacisoli]|jgi:curved DNA-binding protein CbpA|uniref:J domain-containing protein n=1 Tax=Paraburkholderia panacisoli TaxID=2603818 RepID=A0A5B0GFZ7_9BURK|nr:J domain-containing protein [Paraburkholderia panacisoli]KAA1001755.1 J domain-containing protein [Paraburkholderia panacisoli]